MSADLERSAGRILVLALHDIDDGTNPSPWVLAADELERGLDALASRGWPVVSASDAERGTRDGVLLTFDDARYGAAQWLLRRGPAAGVGEALVFVATGLTDQPERAPEAERYSPFAAWSDLEAVRAAGHQIGSHAHRHVRLAGLAPAVVDEELRRSRDLLRDRMEVVPRTFAFPYGAHDGPSVAAVRHARFAWAATTDRGLNGATDFCGGLVRRSTVRADRGPLIDQIASVIEAR